MTTKKNRATEWRELALNLYNTGLGLGDIASRVFEEFGDVFANKESCIKNVEKYLKQRTGEDIRSFDEQVQSEKNRIIKNRKEREKRENARKIAATEIIAERCIEYLKIAKPLNVKPFEVKVPVNTIKETAVLMISDVQAGTYINLEATGGLNSYGWKDLVRQFKNLYTGLEETVVRMKLGAPIDELHIHCLGDLIEGIDIYRGQAQHVDSDLIDQTFGVLDLLCEFVVKCTALFKKVKFIGVMGNHGRVGMKGENPHHVNWEYVIYRCMEYKLSEYKQIEIIYSKSFWQIDQIYGKNFLLSHGDTIRGWNGIPYYGFDRQTRRWEGLFRTLDKQIDYVEIGHHHIPTELSDVIIKKYINGCWPGGSMFALKDLATSTIPSQKFLIVHPIYGVTYRNDILLDPPKK